MDLPLGGGLSLRGTPLGGSGRGSSSTPLSAGTLSSPLLSGGSSSLEASGGSTPGVGGNGLSGLLDQLLLLNLLLGLSLRVTVCKLLVGENLSQNRTGVQHTEVQINHDVPGGLAVVDGATQTKDLTSEHPPDAANGVATLVVGGDGNVDELGGGVRVAEGDDGDVDVGSLLDGLGIGARVGDNDQAGLLEGSGDVVGERTGGETASNGLGAGVGGELEDSTLTIGTSRDNTDISGVVDGGDDASGQNNLLPVRGRMLDLL